MKVFFKYSLSTITVVLLFSFFVGLSFAQDTSQIQEKYGVTFPIAQLGNCNSINECRVFCDDPVNSTVCVEYAKNKGFYKEEEVEKNKESALKSAKNELGCDSEVSCRNLCEQQANFSKCSQFARKYNIGGGIVENPASGEIVKKAQETLGCNSETGCKSFCEKEENRTRCSEFAKTVGLRGGDMKLGPGGCSSEETCKAFCSVPDNYRICQSFAGAQGGSFSGPGNCSSEESCRKYCQENPSVCGYRTNTQESKQYNPIDMCNRTPSCYWRNNSCSCDSNYQSASLDPAQQCIKYTGCTWSGSSCKCTTPIYASNYTYDAQEHKASCISGGCNWTGTGCDCSGTNGPAIQCGNKGCSWVNSACQCGSYSPSTNTSTTNVGQEGSSMERDQQEYYCKAGGGTCDWGSGYCYCKGYTSTSTSTSTSNSTSTSTNSNTSSSGTSTGTSGSSSSTTTNTTQNTPPQGMTRETQEAGCRSCGGTCNWNGDFCSCNCGTSQTTSTPPPPPPPPPPAYVDPYEQCIQSGGSWAGGQCYPGGVQGASIVASFWDLLMSLVGK